LNKPRPKGRGLLFLDKSNQRLVGREKYLREREQIQQLYQGEDFVPLTLEKLME